mmetsp:Transcript_12152/g.17522  ORF Transcript_12152/g.17522 Transcript_12152/m.17522 type:complete len:151 (-) Transcript_12152:854-1306(-)|eukprot:CAMPEP_0172419716 /NCGR_PEP_ID=MMETSP1064-20121228/6104_1 /TAXON_ID=202472 /ORGANISM="Aulacoseira subarctica , Strain CCAP 1002/5" /LENGTH=150 /DNA_ID=CAMNT_0013159309 /DNA_START=80 /DNA_END=532 /DNA_ORIENTATION=-
MTSTSPNVIPPCSEPKTLVSCVDNLGCRLDEEGNLIVEDEVPSPNGGYELVGPGDLVLILSKSANYYGQVGHVMGFTRKRIQVFLTDRHYGRAFDAKNLDFVCFCTDPDGVAYHKKWDTGYQYQGYDESSGVYVEVMPQGESKPSGCVLL